GVQDVCSSDLELQFAAAGIDGALDGEARGQFLAVFGIAYFVIDTQAIFPFDQPRGDAKTLRIARGTDVLDAGVHDGPEEAGLLHARIVVVDTSQQRGARGFEIAEVVAVPDDVHGVEVLEGNLKLHAGAETSHDDSPRSWKRCSRRARHSSPTP